MSSDPRSDVVVGQYERWMYPEPIEDLPGWLAHNWQWFDPSHAQRMFWPHLDYRPDMDILIAGCGTNQAAVFAYNNPEASVVAIDVSQPSLDHHEYLARTYGLNNLELHLLPIEEVEALGREFDLIVSTGVLHHLADPQVGMDALARCVRPNGVVALMLYARYGRIGVEIMEGVYRDLGLRQDQESIDLVRRGLESLPADHPVKSYLSFAPDLRFDAGLVDTFLHGRERSYTVDECLHLVASAGLDFHGWFLKSPYEPVPDPGNPFVSAVAALPDRQRWSVMERLNTRNGCHFFMARHPHPTEVHTSIDFAQPNAVDLVPVFRYRCGLEGVEVVRPNWRMTLDPAQLTIARAIDGQRTIHQIVDQAIEADPAIFVSRQTASEFALNLCRSLWLRDFVAFVVRGCR